MPIRNNNDILCKMVLKAKALVQLRQQAESMESARLGGVSRSNYIKVALAFVEEISRIEISEGVEY